MEIVVAAFGTLDSWMYISPEDTSMEGMFVPVTVLFLKRCQCQLVGVIWMTTCSDICPSGQVVATTSSTRSGMTVYIFIWPLKISIFSINK
jgi:hypothetical protein